MDLSGADPANYGLTGGIISVILNNLKPAKPKVQLLDFKEIGGSDLANKRYRLMISDGRNKFAFAMISSQMVHLIDEKKITAFSIIQLEEYVCNIQTQNNTEMKILIITKVALVQAGNEVGGIVGTPTDSAFSRIDLSGANPASFGIREGVISMILNQRKPIRPKVQLLDFKELGQREGDVSTANKRYRLMISDGRNNYAFAMIPSQMVHLIDEGTVTHWAIIQLDEYICNTQRQNNMERIILIITKMSLVRAGEEVGGIVGTPTPFPDRGNQNGHVAMQPAKPLHKGSGLSAPTGAALNEILQRENDRLKRERICKVCLDASIEMSFQPCGHSFICLKCSGLLDICPICRTVIEKKLRIFIS